MPTPRNPHVERVIPAPTLGPERQRTPTQRSRYVKAKGQEAEKAVATWLAEHGFPNAEPRRLRGCRDAGDIAGLPDVVIEVKDQTRIRLYDWIDEAETEAAHVGFDTLPLVIVKRPRTLDVGRWFMVVQVDHGVELLPGWAG